MALSNVILVQPTANRKKNLRTKKKEGVELVMKFRNHKDPLYYDANANDKIFVSAYMVSANQQHYNSLIGGGSHRGIKKAA